MIGGRLTAFDEPQGLSITVDIYDLAIADLSLPMQAAAAICALLAALIGFVSYIEKATEGDTRPSAGLLPIARNRAIETSGVLFRWFVETVSTSPRGPPGRHRLVVG